VLGYGEVLPVSTVTCAVKRVEGSIEMEFIGLLAPVAFVFALAVLAQVGQVKKQLGKVEQELASLRSTAEVSQQS